MDTEGIADGEVFPEAIKRAIEQSDAFLFVITPSSVESRYCEQEVEYARDLQKRIVPLLREFVPDSDLPAEIRDRNWVPLTDDAEFEPSVGRLLKALDTDLAAAQAHTRWLVKALEWEAEARDRSFLLRGSELRAAETWLASQPEDADPAPTQLQREYLLASREAAARRQRVLMSGLVGVAAVSIGLLIFALISRSDAVSERVAATAQALGAESQSQVSNDPEISVILGRAAVRKRATPESMFALRAALDASPLQVGLPTVPSPGSCGVNSGLSAAYRPDGRRIALGTCDGLLRFVNPATDRVVRAERVAEGITSLAYSPSGGILAVGTNRGVTLVDPFTGQFAARSAGTIPYGVDAIAFSPSGHLLAADDRNGITIWTLPGLKARTLERDPNEGGTMVFSRDGGVLIVGGIDNSVHIYDVRTGRLVHRINTAAAGQTGGSWEEVVALSPDGAELAIGYPSVDGNVGTVSIYNTVDWRLRFTLMSIDEVQISALAFSPDGMRLAVGAEDGTSGVWSLATRKQLAAYDGPTAAVTGMAFAPDGRSVLTVSNDGIARIWRALGAEQAYVPVDGNGDYIALAPGRLSILEEGYGHSWLTSFRLPRGQPLGTWHLQGARDQFDATLSADGQYLATTGGGRGEVPTKDPIRIWNVARRSVVRTLPSASVSAVYFSPDDSRLVIEQVHSEFGVPTVTVDNLVTGGSVRIALPTACDSSEGDFVISRNDRTLASESFCGYADVWSLPSGRLLRQVNQGGEASSVDLSPDGSRLLVSSWDSRATIWSVRTGHRLVNLIGDTRGINAAGFNPDGQLVVTESLDHTVRLWDAHTGQELRVLTFPYDQDDFAFSVNGQQLAISENTPLLNVDDVVRVFDTCPDCTNPHGLLQLSAHQITTQLTELERTVVDAAGDS